MSHVLGTVTLQSLVVDPGGALGPSSSNGVSVTIDQGEGGEWISVEIVGERATFIRPASSTGCHERARSGSAVRPVPGRW